MSQEQVHDLANLFYREQTRNNVNSVKAMRVVIEHYEAGRAPDARVVELVRTARRAAQLLDWHDVGGAIEEELRSALAAMENGNG